MSSNENILASDEEITSLLRNTKTITVLGIKPESHFAQPPFYVPKYMQDAGYKIVPVPVYYPDVTKILGEQVYRHLSEIKEPVDMVNVFRRPQDIPQHVEEIISAKPTSVWFQSGIVNDAAAEAFAREGIKVVQNRCLLVEHRTLIY